MPASHADLADSIGKGAWAPAMAIRGFEHSRARFKSPGGHTGLVFVKNGHVDET